MQEEPSQSKPIMISIYEKAAVEHKKIFFFYYSLQISAPRFNIIFFYFIT